MASPLRWFRKNEKILLGVFGVGIMFVFTLSIGSGIDPIIDWLSGGGVQTKSSIAGPLVVKWDGGSLNEAELFNMKQNRNMVTQYLFAVEQQASMRGRTPETQPLPRDNGEESLLELALLQKEARDQGIVITDESVLNYLNLLAGGSMQPAEFLDLWQMVTQGRGTERQLFSIMRSELAAARLRGLAWSGTRAASPVAFWDFYNRTEKRVDAELMAVDVANFVDDVPEPSEGELKQFYDLYASKHARPGSPDPGFRQRRRLAFEAVRFDFQEFLEVEKAAVTDEEIEKYYEENKDEFAETLPEDDLKAPESAETAGDDAADTDAADADADTGDAAEKTETPSENMNDIPAEVSSDEQIEEPDPTPSPLPQTDEESATTVEETSDATAITASDSKEEASADAADSKPAEEDDSTDDSNDEKADSAAKSEIKPLSEVKDDIRRAIASPRAQEKMQAAIKSTRSQMNKYYKQYVMFEVRQKKDETLEPPTMPTFDEINEDPPINVSSIPLSDRFEVEQFELGQALEFQFMQDRILRIPFAELVYEEKTIPLYQPRKFPSADVSPQYVYWAVGQEEAITPKLDDIRDAVVDAWKMKQAAGMARAAAEEQAEKARKAGTKLTECLDYPNATIFQSGEISWLTGGNLPVGGNNPPRISQIPGVESPSEEMFSRLFRLNPGEVTVAMDGAHTTAYVMRCSEPTSPMLARAEQFMSNGINSPALYPILRNESQSLLSGWYNDLKDKYELTWLREPQSASRM